ncbi:MAG: phenylacetate--CoA ligase family protein [Burkholderiales bacterium]|nr:phenylacetate--CoA ligase family protein [Burkholderiales bacterium]
MTADAVLALQRSRTERRLHELVAHAQQRSPFYRRHWQGWQPGRDDWHALPPVDKPRLMENFDDWATDRAVTLAGVRAFIAEPANIGADYLGRYAVWTSSGTTGQPGIFLHDGAALATYAVLSSLRVDPSLLMRHLMPGLLFGPGRSALVAALDGHYASVCFWQRQCRLNPWLAQRSRVFSVTQPMAALCAQLQAWQPALLASYPSMLVELAERQQRGALALRPSTLWAGGEALSGAERAFVERVFGAPAANDYGCSEALAIAVECRCGRLHLHDDWVLLEPVDAANRSVPPGEPSDAVLLTNLANRIAPVIRYRLGDSVCWHTEPCPCGNARPTISVRGRCDDLLHLADAQGRQVPVSPLALVTLLEERAGIYHFQLRQTGPSSLALRLGADESTPAAQVLPLLARYLGERGLPAVHLQHEAGAPEADRPSGKLRRVLRLAEAAT